MAPGAGAPLGDDAELEVGRIGRAHGLLGEVRVDLWSEPSRLEPGSVLSSDRGPLTVAAARPHGAAYLVHFEAVADRTSAESLRGVVLRARPLARPGTLWVHELIGATVTSTDGRSLGVVVAVEANPASDLLVLEGGGLVPLRFVVGHEAGGQVVVDIPEGLLD
ncbi:MAG: ribosome maturation factor RimM [Acidimicrobiales bacterium]